MATSNTINLIKTKTIATPEHEAITASLRRSGYIMLIILISLGLLTGVLYTLFSAEENNLINQKKEYMSRVESDREIEGFFRSIKERTRIVRLTIASKKPWSQLLTQVQSVVSPPILTNIAVDNKDTVIITVTSPSVDTILPIVNTLMNQAQGGRIRQPNLVSLQILKTGSVTALFSFIAMF
jgi:hypothetical protein